MARSINDSLLSYSDASSGDLYTPSTGDGEEQVQLRGRRSRGRGRRSQGRGRRSQERGARTRRSQERGARTRGGFRPQGIQTRSRRHMDVNPSGFRFTSIQDDDLYGNSLIPYREEVVEAEEEGQRGQVRGRPRGRGLERVGRHEEEEEVAAAATMLTLRPGIGNSCATNSNGRPGLDNSRAIGPKERREIGNSQATNCIGGCSVIIQPPIDEGGTTSENIVTPNPQEGPKIDNSQASNGIEVGSALAQQQLNEEETRSKNSAILDNTNMLDCPFCFKTFSIPVLQCVKGHPACSSCCSNHDNNCPSCSSPITDTPCLLMEEFLKSVKVPCLNSKYGCKKILSYGKKLEHEQSCPHEACYCPLPGCDFNASYKDLYRHFACEHPASATPFTFDSSFLVHLSANMKFIFLQECDHTLFILNYGVLNIGNVANIICVGPSGLKNEYSYELEASSAEGGTVKVTCPSTQSLTKWTVCIPEKPVILVPKDMVDSSQRQKIQVCIRKKR